MNRLEFRIVESPDTNDHQVRIVVDGDDWLKDDYLGVDPPELFSQEALLEGGEVIVGRCTCGVVGCGDCISEIEIGDHNVIWRVENGSMFEFVKNQYMSTIEKQMVDHSWEDNNRTAERLVSEIFKDVTLDGNYKFTWASARIEKGKIKLSFIGGVDQKMFEFPWDPEDPESAGEAAKKAVKEIPFIN